MVLPIDIILVRHGQSEGNLAMSRGKGGDRSVFDNEHFKKKHSSLYRLTSLGIEQAQTSGKWIQQNIGQIDEFYVSEYIRAMETAAYLDLPHAKWKVDFMLRERDWGQREYKPFEERLKYRHSIENRLHSFFFVPGRGESIAQMCSRLMKIVNDLHSKCSDKKVVIVCHSYVMRAFRVLFESISQDDYREISKGFVDRRSPEYIHNGQIFHYTRRDPFNGRLSSKLKYKRCINPTDTNSPSNTGWMKMTDIKKRFGNRDLLEAVKQIPRILDNGSPSPLPLHYKQESFSIPKQYFGEIVEEDEDDTEEEENEDEEDECDGDDEKISVSTRKDYDIEQAVDIEGDIIAVNEEEIEEIEGEEEQQQNTEGISNISENHHYQVRDNNSVPSSPATSLPVVLLSPSRKKIRKLTRKTFVRVDRSAMKKLINGIAKDEKKMKKKKKKKTTKTMFAQ